MFSHNQSPTAGEASFTVGGMFAAGGAVIGSAIAFAFGADGVAEWLAEDSVGEVAKFISDNPDAAGISSEHGMRVLDVADKPSISNLTIDITEKFGVTSLIGDQYVNIPTPEKATEIMQSLTDNLSEMQAENNDNLMRATNAYQNAVDGLTESDIKEIAPELVKSLNGDLEQALLEFQNNFDGEESLADSQKDFLHDKFKDSIMFEAPDMSHQISTHQNSIKILEDVIYKDPNTLVIAGGGDVASATNFDAEKKLLESKGATVTDNLANVAPDYIHEIDFDSKTQSGKLLVDTNKLNPDAYIKSLTDAGITPNAEQVDAIKDINSFSDKPSIGEYARNGALIAGIPTAGLAYSQVRKHEDEIAEHNDMQARLGQQEVPLTHIAQGQQLASQMLSENSRNLGS